METIKVYVLKEDVQSEVAKATDYTGSKLIDGDEGARDRILAADADLESLDILWEEAALAVNERFKRMLVTGRTNAGLWVARDEKSPGGFKVYDGIAAPTDPGVIVLKKEGYEAEIEVSKAFDKELSPSVQSMLRSFFISSITGGWFRFANKAEAKDYIDAAEELLTGAERLLYTRKRPRRPER